jgi:protein SCO1/2
MNMLACGYLWLSLITSAAPSDVAGDSRLAVIQKAPRWLLINQNGKEIDSSNLGGRVCLVSFIFTTCNGSCPATTHRMEKVQTALRAAGLLKKGQVHLLSITLDPARDTPSVLKRYQQLYDADPASWDFLTGPSKQVGKVISAFGMWVRAADNGQLDHPSRIFLIDQRSRVREIYNLSFLRPEWVVEDVKLLLEESQQQ